MKKMITLISDSSQKANNVAPKMNSKEWMIAINKELTTIVKNAGINIEEENEEALYAALSKLLRQECK